MGKEDQEEIVRKLRKWVNPNGSPDGEARVKFIININNLKGESLPSDKAPKRSSTSEFNVKEATTVKPPRLRKRIPWGNNAGFTIPADDK